MNELDFETGAPPEVPPLESPLKLSISITHKCNLHCKPCYANCGSSPDRVELSTKELLNFISYLDLHGFVQAHIEGGEPFTRPDILEILAYSTPRLLTWVRTNGTLIDQSVASELRSINIGTVCVDIWGSTAATHDYLTGTPGSFEAACRGIDYLNANGVDVLMLLILTQQNVAELNAYLKLARRLNVRRVGILRLYPLGRAREQWSDLSLPIAVQMEALRGLSVPEGLTVMQSWHPKDGNCCSQSSAINAYGDSIGCVYLRDYVNFGSIRNEEFLSTWGNPLYKLIRSGVVDKHCPECSRSQGSHGGCRSTAFAFHGSWTAPDPYCEHLNGGTDVTRLPK